MTDISSQVREMFRRREADLPPLVQPPHGLSARVRRRQTVTAVVAAATAVSVGAGGAVAYRTLDRTGTHVPASEAAGMKTAHVGPVSITYPTGWQVTAYERLRDLAKPASKIALTNFEADLGDEDVCAAMPSTGVILLIYPSPDPDPGSPEFQFASDREPWPVRIRPTAAPEHCGGFPSDGSVWWRVGSDYAARSFAADAFIGAQASDADRERLLEAFSRLTFLGDGGPGAAGVVLASGEIDGRPWTVSVGLRQGVAQYGPYITLSAGSDGGGLSGTGGPISGVKLSGAISLSATVMHGNTILYGFVREDVANVQVDPEGAEPFDTPLYDMPTGVDASFRTFVAPMRGAPRGTVAIFDMTGATLAEIRFAPGFECGGDEPCPGAAAGPGEPGGGPVATGSTGGTRWRLVYEGDALRLVDQEGQILGQIRETPNPLLVDSVTLGAGGQAATFIFGMASPETRLVTYFSGDIASSPPSAVLSDGRVAFWLGLSPASDAGQILTFDTECRLLAAVSIRTGSPPAQPAEIGECEA